MKLEQLLSFRCQREPFCPIFINRKIFLLNYWSSSLFDMASPNRTPNSTIFIPAEWIDSYQSKYYDYFPGILMLIAQRMFVLRSQVWKRVRMIRLICGLWLLAIAPHPTLLFALDGKAPPILMWWSLASCSVSNSGPEVLYFNFLNGQVTRYWSLRFESVGLSNLPGTKRPQP